MNDKNPIDVARVIDEGNFGRYRALVAGSCMLVAIGDGFDAQALAYVAPQIAQEWALDTVAFGPLFAISLFGLMIGSLILGPLADRRGRKSVMLGSFFAVGVFSLLTATAQNVEQLALYRFLTGIGLGGTVPNIVSLTAEYAPRRYRTTLVTLMSAGFPLGAVFGGLLIAQNIDDWGWRSVFVCGGVLPIVISIVLAIVLPESLGILARQSGREPEMRRILRRLEPSLTVTEEARFVAGEAGMARASITTLFAPSFLNTTLMIWLAVFFNLLVTYFMLNWLPMLLTASGSTLEQAITGTMLFNVGGILGGIALAQLVDRWGATSVLAPLYGITIALIAALGFASSLSILYVCVFLAGVGVLGGQLCLYGFMANLYPTTIRATGVGWALGVGRLGSVAGPLIGGWILTLGFAPQHTFVFAGIPILVCLAAIVALKSRGGSDSRLPT